MCLACPIFRVVLQNGHREPLGTVSATRVSILAKFCAQNSEPSFKRPIFYPLNKYLQSAHFPERRFFSCRKLDTHTELLPLPYSTNRARSACDKGLGKTFPTQQRKNKTQHKHHHAASMERTVTKRSQFHTLHKCCTLFKIMFPGLSRGRILPPAENDSPVTNDKRATSISTAPEILANDETPFLLFLFAKMCCHAHVLGGLIRLRMFLYTISCIVHDQCS